MEGAPPMHLAAFAFIALLGEGGAMRAPGAQIRAATARLRGGGLLGFLRLLASALLSSLLGGTRPVRLCALYARGLLCGFPLRAGRASRR